MERAFRLAGLLRLRELQEDQAAGALAVSNVALRSAEHQRQVTLTTLAAHTMPAAADPSGWRTSVTTRGALRHLLADAAIDVRDAGERVAADTAVWAAARSRSVGLEKLRDQHRALVQADDARTEQLALDEVAARSAGAAPAPGPSSVPSPRRATRTLPHPPARALAAPTDLPLPRTTEGTPA